MTLFDRLHRQMEEEREAYPEQFHIVFYANCPPDDL